jgi:septal ring factor EnvC (AmiA/AmiB activator)
MNRSNKGFVVLLVAVLGMWGCSQSSSTPGTSAGDRVRNLEQKCAKLEDDCRNLLVIRDQMKKNLASIESDNARLARELEQKKVIQQERDSFRQLAEARSTERDVLQSRCEKLKKGLQTLIGQDDSIAPASPTNPVSSNPMTNDGGQS